MTREGFYKMNSDITAKRKGSSSCKGKTRPPPTTEANKIKTRKKEEESDGFSLRDFLKSVCNLMCYSSRCEASLMIVGTMFALINGTMTPLMSVVFGDSANVFLLQERRALMPTCSQADNITLHCITAQARERGEHEFVEAIDRYTVRYLIVFAVAVLTAFLQIYCWERASDTIVLALRKAYLSQLLRQNLEWFDKNTMGDLSAKLTDDLERIRDGMGARVPILVQSFSLLVSGHVVAYCRSWKLSLVLLPALPVIAVCVAFVASISSKSSHREQLRYGVAGGIASEAMSGIRTVCAFGAERYTIKRYEKALDEGRKLTVCKHYALAILTGVLNFCCFAFYSLGFWFGAGLYLKGELSPGSILTILYCILQAGLAFGANLVALIEVSTAIALTRNVFSVIKRIPTIDPYSETGAVLDLRGEIHLQQVSFSYPTRPEIKVLHSIDIKVQPGQVLALVGPSGGGKSSIVNLIMRFYDPTTGKVLLDGREMSGLNLKTVRSQIGVVSQEPILFDTTVKENIRYGCQQATDEEVVAAAQMANAHFFIMDLPHGYDTLVGERGSQLSGGQKQRLAIARALVRKPKILLLDEATSALDSESEALVQQALDRAMQGRTTVVIAHRLSTVRNAHLICVIKDGVVAERGTHSELMSMRGHYFHLVTMQKRRPDNLNHEHFEQIDLQAEQKALEKKRKMSTKSEKGIKRVSIKVSDAVGKSVSFLSIFRLKTLPLGLISMTLLGCLISGMLVPIFAILYSDVVQMFALPRRTFYKKLITWEIIILSLAFLSCFSYFISLLGSCLSTERMIQTVRLETFRNILSQQVSWFDNKQFTTLRLTNTLARDPPQIKAVAGSRFGSLLTGSINLVLAVGVALYANWRLASVCCLVYPLLIFLTNRQTALRYINFAKEDVKIKAASKLAAECIQNIKTVQMLGLEGTLYTQYAQAMDHASRSSRKQTILYSLIYSTSSSIIYLIYVAASKYGGDLLVHHKINLVHVLRILFEVSFTAPIIGLACNFTQDFIKGKQAVHNLIKLKSAESSLDAFSLQGEKQVEVRGGVELREVEFSYPCRPGVKVLRGLNLVVEPGQRVAIVGRSGCGKSTIVSLLERFYSQDRGRILVDGVDVEKWNVGHLRRSMGLVTQEPVLFEGTIRENIMYGCLDRDPEEVTDQQIIHAARMANIHDFIVSLPQGYETSVGSRGTKLSGGEKQRVAIARALVRNPRILLLDEATSALDNHSEKVVQEALEKASEGRTTLVIAHRLSTVQSADVIVVIEEGRVVERGHHSQLVALGGKYCTMTRGQHLNL